MSKLQDLAAELDQVRSELLTLDELDELTDEQETRAAELITKFDTLKEEHDRLEVREAKLAEIRSAEIVVERGDGAMTRDLHVNRGGRSDNIYDLGELRHLDQVEYGREIGDRVRRAIDSWDDYKVAPEHQQSALRLVANARRSNVDREIAEQILRTGSPEYHDAFVAYLRGGTETLSSEQRTALNEGTNSQGGFLVPPMLDPTIILTNNSATNPFRSIATVKSINTQTWKGVTSAGVTAEWIAEANEVADASPTFVQPTITPAKADAYVQASIEMLQDTDISTEIAMLLADARDRLEAAAFATGSGSGQPKGIVTALQAVTASRVAGSSGAAGAADFVLADVYALVNALPPRHRPNSSWLGEQTTLNRIRRFGEGTTGSMSAFWADLGAAIPPLLLGRPVYESSEMDNTIVSGSNDDILIFGDFKKFYIVDRIGMSVLYEPLVKGSNRRPTGEVGWVAFWRTGADTVDANAFRMLRL